MAAGPGLAWPVRHDRLSLIFAPLVYEGRETRTWLRHQWLRGNQGEPMSDAGLRSNDRLAAALLRRRQPASADGQRS